ncbi:MAG: MBOAT family O-acyltransferase [Lachnospiraceae bacterium]|nr:MBOAT family O-acyltransferase [Lachnospiraceae bacterium]
MSFSSLIFIALFLPVFMIGYVLVRGNQRKNLLLLLFSLVFYAFAGLSNLALLLVMTMLAWFIGQRIGRALRFAASENPDYQEGDDDFQSPDAERTRVEGQKRARAWLILALVLLIAVLLFYKLVGPIGRHFFPANAGELDAGGGATTGAAAAIYAYFRSIGLPLGISFYIFKLISYVADVYTKKTAPGDFFHVLLYTVTFHQVAQGPITRYAEMAEEMDHRRADAEDLAEGLWRFTVGLAKKTVLADHLGTLAETFLPLAGNTSFSVGGAYLGALCYMLQLYLDFSAYSDMALGLGRMIGFHYPENFNYPYIAVSVRDFWRRWHISLSRFFRDYVYIPLGGNRVSTGRLLLNLLAVWALTGFWHGSSWNFILWGLYYFVFIAIENFVRKFQKAQAVPVSEGSAGRPDVAESVAANGTATAARPASASDTKRNAPVSRRSLLTYFTRALGHLYTLIVVFFGWVLFRFSDFQVLCEVLRTMFFMSGRATVDAAELLTLRSNLFFLIFSIIACTPLGSRLAAKLRGFYDASLQQEAREKQQLEREKARYQKETEIDQQVQRLDASIEGLEEEDAENHARVATRMKRRITKSSEARRRSEGLYYGLRILLMLLLLAVSIVSMVGASYTPFLYNQF